MDGGLRYDFASMVKDTAKIAGKAVIGTPTGRAVISATMTGNPIGVQLSRGQATGASIMSRLSSGSGSPYAYSDDLLPRKRGEQQPPR